MFDIDTFCDLIWKQKYDDIINSIDKTSYNKFLLPKKNGYREIVALSSNSMLWKLQKQLTTRYLNFKPLPVCVKGFVRGENYISFLDEHIGSSFFMRVDIASFFPSITEKMINETLEEIVVFKTREDKDKIIHLISEIVLLDGKLPQGACSSPVVSNLVMARIDQRITKYCQVLGVKYTRYADDLLFSSLTFDFDEKKWFLKKIKHILGTASFRINYSKLKIGKAPFALNGFIIYSNGVRLSRKRLKNIRHLVSFSDTNCKSLLPDQKELFLKGLNSTQSSWKGATTKNFDSLFKFVQYLCGYRSFLLSLIDSFLYTDYHQREIERLIRRIEKQVQMLSELSIKKQEQYRATKSN